MSGGSLDYVYGKLDEAIVRIKNMATTPLEKAFAKHLALVSEALHDIEWVYSNDYSMDQAKESLSKVLGSGATAAQMEIVRDDLRALIGNAKELLGGLPSKEFSA